MDIDRSLRSEIARILTCEASDIDVSRSLGELGFDSVDYVEFAAFIRKRFDVPLKPETLFEHNSVSETMAGIASLLDGAAPRSPQGGAVPHVPGAPAGAGDGARDVAIIGASARLPGAGGFDALWDMVAGGASALGPYPAQRSASDAAPPSFLRGGFIDDADAFDASFFGISRREAIAMDPQQRITLEAAWHAFEDAGCSAQRLSGSDTAVFVGAASFDYYELLTSTGAARTTHIGTGVSHAVIANRVSQFFNLKGASEAVDAACASSLVAIMRGVDAIRRGDNALVLAGGVNLLASRTPFQVFADAGMLSEDGVCRPFDDAAAGYVRGEGAGFVVLKQAQAAIRDGDRILAIVKGGAVQHGGRTQSLTAPSPEAQANVIVAAMEDAGVDPASIGYVEAHGTGTPLGDPIEALGLNKAFARMHGKFGRTGVAPHFFIGSIKAQIGHLEAAAGVAGVLKAVCALGRRAIPGSPYLGTLNRHIVAEESAFRIAPACLPWDGVQAGIAFGAGTRRAGVSSFGFGGANAHLVLEEAPPVPARTPAEAGPRLFLFSAKSGEALRRLCARYVAWLQSQSFGDSAHEQIFLDDVAYTLRDGRSALGFRLALPAASVAELVCALGLVAQHGMAAQGVQLGQVSATTDPASHPLHQRDLAALAGAWVAGMPIASGSLARDGARLAALPQYPFEKERFWAYAAGAAAPGAAFYRTHWSLAPLAPCEPSPLAGALLVFIAGPHGQRVADAVQRALPGNAARVLLIPACGDVEETPGDAAAGRFGAVLDLTPLDDAYLGIDIPAKLALLRRLIGPALKRGEAIRIVHATCGLQDIGAAGAAPATLAGAQDVGLYEHFSAEYKRCVSKTIDFGSGADALPRQLVAELMQADGRHALAYRGEQRYARCMVPMEGPLPANGQHEFGSAMITGASGDIGLCLAQDLVERGCRALLLTGRSALAPHKQASVDALAARGARIVFYQGELTDAEALQAQVDAFGASHGRITHVFHCAGAADTSTPAFYQKTSASIARVMQPKVAALLVLHAVFLQQPPRHFVLFSSLSSVAAKCAVGVLDYAAANRFLDLFAHYQHGQGRHYYRAIQWTRWDKLGLAKNALAASSGAGRALPASHCLDAMHAILASGADLPPSVCVVAEGDSVLAVAPQAVEPASTPARPAGSALQREALRHALQAIFAKELETPVARLDDQASFEALGIDSIVLMGLITAIENWLGIVVDPQELIDRNSIGAVADYLWGKLSAESLAAMAPAPQPRAAQPAALAAEGAARTRQVAVIGMACRFPGAADTASFWRNLKAGIDSVGPVPASRWSTPDLYAAKHAPGRSISRWGGFIDDIEWVDPKLFGMGADDAADIDPLVRLFTECSLEAAADTVRGVDGIKGQRVGVFVGARAGGYGERIERPGKHSVTGIGQNFIAAHVTHLLDLHGPSLVLDSACSSSLAAIHLACQSLFCGDSDMALAGGVEVLLDEKPYLFLSAAHALSPDGRCRPFDANANGFVPGEGVGCVLLKPLERALADGDPVYAVIEGSAMNNDGRTLGITTPGVAGQVDVIERALRSAGVAPSAISYVEAHGTGTLIGDPIELQSLARAFQADPPAQCAVGSVKSNLGHLLSAAGVASFIKVALALHHKALPPTIHCEQVNPRFDFEQTPFYPVRALQQWDGAGAALRAGVSAFGFGKTNVHIVLGERPAAAHKPQERMPPAGANAGKVRAWHAPTLPQPPAVAASKTSLLGIEVEYFEELETESEA